MKNKIERKGGVKPPKFLKRYFWEVDFGKLDAKKSAEYVVNRLLEYGDEKAVRWMLDRFGKKQIKYVLCKYRGYSEKSANFWALVLGVPRNKVLCLQKSYLEMRKRTWPY